MNPLLIRRRGMMKAQQGGLPYDSMVEYLQTDGNQYIDTGLDTALDAVSYNNIFDVEFVTIGTSSKIYSLSYPNAAIQIYTSNNNRIYNQAAFLAITTGVKYTINAGTTSTARSIRIGSNLNQQAFSRSINDEKRIYILGAPPAANMAGSVAKIYNYKILKNSAEIFDAIPVRVGTVGYMYDRVSGQLFGNLGTGDFILGPDVI